MKKSLAILLMVITLFGCLQVSASASETGITPRLNNVSSAQTKLLFKDDVAIVSLNYEAYSIYSVSAKITTTLQKKFMLFWWKDLVTWTDTSTASDIIIEHSYATSSGTHRVLATYEIVNVETGVTDVIEHELEVKN